MIYKLQKIRMSGNEHGQLRADTIYAELVDCDGKLKISATLEYILGVIRDRNFPVEGVTVFKNVQRGSYCSEITLDLYKEAKKEKVYEISCITSSEFQDWLDRKTSKEQNGC